MLSVSLILLFLGAISVGYFYALLAAAWKAPSPPTLTEPSRRFLILIAAHNESAVIGRTVRRLNQLRYPRDLYEIHVVADHCTDRTTEEAAATGAQSHSREEGERGKKSAALAWLFDRVKSPAFDAVVVFDADAQVHEDFLSVMNAALERGEWVIQGQQIISNAEAGWYPALTAAMYLIDNAVHNRGRFCLGGSARHMGDSLCLRKDIVDKLGFGEGLTEDHVLRQRLLLAGIRIAYEPSAVAYNEAAPTWSAAKVQRTRWMAGTVEGDDRIGMKLLRSQSFAAREAGIEILLPSYSTLAVMSTAVFLAHALIGSSMTTAFGLLVGLVALFPFAGLWVAGGGRRDYGALLAGPFFLVWRTGLALCVRLFRRDVAWVRTPREQT